MENSQPGPTAAEREHSPVDDAARALADQPPPRRFLWSSVSALLVLFLLTLSVESVELPVAEKWYVAWLLALIPPVVFAPLVLWLDRYEPEPRWLLGIVFLWGAFGASLLSGVINAVVGVVAGQDTALVGSAPVIEELTKGVALFALVRYRRDEFDGVLDGLVYATTVALGFAMTENVLYFGRAALGLLGEASVGATFVGRGLLTPLAHPLFTSLTGLGLGLAVRWTGLAARSAAAAGGLLAAMVLHHVWNRSAREGQWGDLYVLLFAPLLFLLVAIAVLARRRERRVLAAELAPEVTSGVITAAEYAELLTPKLRRARLRRALLSRGVGAWAEIFRLHELMTDLAFRKRRQPGAPEFRSYRAAIGLVRTRIPPGL